MQQMNFIIEQLIPGFRSILKQQLQKMCVDDYQFRHHTATRDKICRKFIFVDEDEFAKTYLVNISQFEEYGDVGLCKILIYLSTKGLNIQNRKFYLPKFCAIIEPFTFCRIIFQALDQKEIYLKCYSSAKSSEDIFAENQSIFQEDQNENKEENYFCRFQQIDDIDVINEAIIEHLQTVNQRKNSLQQDTIEQQHSGSQKMVDQSQEKSLEKTDDNAKKAKEPQRGIFQVIKAVKLWRNLYESKRCNLTKAAKVVGISKKSLDDYYLVLRIGEILGFNYATNLQGGMGDLRNYIRSQRQKVKGKLGKNVKCFKLIQDFDLEQVLEQFKLKQGFL